MCLPAQSGGALGGAASGASAGAMLGPWGAAAGAIGGGVFSVLGSRAANKSAKSVEEARRIESENMIAETRRRATDDYLNMTRMEREQQLQEEAATVQKGADVMKETDRAVATSTASAAERGVAGRTIDDIARDYDFQANEETGRLKQNQLMANRQHAEQIRGFGTNFSNRIADARPYVPRPIAPVDYFGPVFGAVGQLGELGMKMEEGRERARKSQS